MDTRLQVPEDPKKPATLARLLTLRAAPGDARVLRAPSGAGMVDVGPSVAGRAAAAAAASAHPRELHLVRNSCWSHTVAVAAAALGASPGEARLALVSALLFRRPWTAVARPPSMPDPVAGALREEKVSRFGTDLWELLSDEERARAARAAAAMEEALRREEVGDG